MQRRTFLKTSLAAGLLAPALRGEGAPNVQRPVVVSSGNGLQATATAMRLIEDGADTLDAVIAGVNIVENDPNDRSVGYGGLPNEDGIVELDSCVMHGPTHRGGAVAALRNIKTPSNVAQTVMERSDHALLVGEGALRFARMHGFEETDLLTDASRESWLRWRENLSSSDDRLPPHSPEDTDIGMAGPLPDRDWGTISCLAVDGQGDISGVTTTSGLSFKIPGRVGDSPIFGAGLYVDNEVGAAGSTGRGEANLLNCSSFAVVEFMRNGDSPEEACLKACQRIVDHNKVARLRDDSGRPRFGVSFYAVSKAGVHGGASIWGPMGYAVNVGGESTHAPGAHLYKRG
jgi:N4-(beta-N-acetylglucosaminyl)-L-asparaginase